MPACQAAKSTWLVMVSVLLTVLTASPATPAEQSDLVAAYIKEGDAAYAQAAALYAAKNYHPANDARATAIRAYKKAIKLDPKSYEAHRKLGDLYFGSGGGQREHAEAIASYGKALELKPDSAYVHSQLSICYLRLDRFTEAIAAAQRAIELGPGNAVFAFNLGFIYADMGRQAEARKIHAKLLAMDQTQAQNLQDKINESSKLSSNAERPKTYGNPKIELVAIKPGSFMMGAEQYKEGRPARISKGFYIGKYPVTQAQWQMVMGDNPSFHKNCGGNCPVERVSWNDAQAFIARLNALKDGRRYRLPSEAEWEYAYKAGGDGKQWDSSDTHWHSQNSGDKTHPVGEKPPNALGIFDMGGHVEEWCMDYYVKDPASPPADGSPLLKTEVQKYRSLRGQSYRVMSSVGTGTRRAGLVPQDTNFNVGLRVAAD